MNTNLLVRHMGFIHESGQGNETDTRLVDVVQIT